MWLWQPIPHYDSHLSINVKTTLFFINFNHSNPRELASLLNVCTLGSNSKSHKRVGKLQYFDKTVVILCHLKWKVTKHTVTIYRIRFNDEIRGKITCIEKTVNWETPLQLSTGIHRHAIHQQVYKFRLASLLYLFARLYLYSMTFVQLICPNSPRNGLNEVCTSILYLRKQCNLTTYSIGV